MTTEVLLEVRRISKDFPDHPKVLSEIDFELMKGETLAVIGNSGGGKSTLLRIIAGFERPDQGEVKKQGSVISGPERHLPPQQRNIGYLFQDFALFPHLTVDRNIQFGWNKKRISKDFLDRLYQLIHMEELGDRYPHELSGGQQQRVALARALAAGPEIILLDEPFSNIDVVRKAAVRNDLKRLLAETETAAIMVTHDYRDALEMADRVMLLLEGKVIQLGSAQDVYQNPVNEHAASLLGPCNAIPAENQGDGRVKVAFGVLPSEHSVQSSGKVLIRPGSIVLRSEGGSFTGTIRSCKFYGSYYAYVIEASGVELLAHASDDRWKDQKEITFDLVSE